MGLFEFFLDSMELEGNILHRNAHDGADLLITQAFEPEENDGAVHQAQLIDAGIQALGLQRPVVSILLRIRRVSDSYKI